MQRGVAAISKQRDHQHLANAHANAALLIHQEPGQYSQYESDCRDRDAVQQKIGHPLGRNDVDIHIDQHQQERSPESQSEEKAQEAHEKDRKSTRLNQSLMRISYAVFCLKKKIKHTQQSNKNAVRM